MEPIVFDKASGISLEEQQEILAGLDTLERPLERIEGGKAVISYEKQAKKKGVLLPALTNGIAAAILALGLATLFLTHERDEVRFMQGVMSGDAAPSVTERTLIAEMRRDFAEQLSAKDAEIAEIHAKVASIDTEMRNVQIQFENKLILESEKDKALADLQRQKNEYQNRLAALQQERGLLLEDARIREAALRSQISANKELSAQAQSAHAELVSAQEALRRITDEQEKNALIDLQIDGYFAQINEQIGAALFDKAASTLSALRDFLDTPSFQPIKAFRERKPARLALVNTLSELAGNSIRLNALASETAAPPVEASFDETSQDNGLSEQIRTYEETIAELRVQNSELERIAAERERSGRDSASASSAALNELGSRNQALRETIASRETSLANLRSQNAALQETIASRESALADLRNQNAALQENIAARESALADLRSQVSSLQQSVTEKDASINSLQGQNSELQQRTEQLQAQNDAIRQLLNN
ncbi:MAG: hypothetical protein LBG43_00935 [Treponema sp.]|jgi:chromosome segregation ATPase|nr:hypothetical protein [Treponema sp.]